jgi:hypothetical protein
MDKIGPDPRGLYAVRTASAAYLLDLDAATATRSPLDPTDTPTSPAGARLRRDGEQVILVAVLACEVDAPMQLLIALGSPGVLTYRRTTTVRAIERLR